MSFVRVRWDSKEFDQFTDWLSALNIRGEGGLLPRFAADMMEGARARWMQLAASKLHSSRKEYQAGIQKLMGDPQKGSVQLVLVGDLANMVEQGAHAFDMHETLLGGRGHTAADGSEYRVIPFRHTAPGSTGGTGQPMGLPIERALAGMQTMAGALGNPYAGESIGKKVYSYAKNLTPSVRGPDGAIHYGGRLPAGLAPKLKSSHSSDIYAGMIKQTGTAQSTQYLTFRTISDNVPDKWMHPGIEARNLVDDVSDFVNNQIGAALSAFLGAK